LDGLEIRPTYVSHDARQPLSGKSQRQPEFNPAKVGTDWKSVLPFDSTIRFAIASDAQYSVGRCVELKGSQS
jgi:hypothetical protein